ncbi:MAG: M20/M25/M40 family metallo-hydrolase [Phycisphaerales bacterium]|nr:MAG: M20/M25/M40 family metallo-hydrolase [Phycisphaerales bacterium]
MPTAPFVEGRVHAYIEDFCRKLRRVTAAHDRAGNILMRYRGDSRRIRRPVCLSAHTDHPGFVAERMIAPGRLRATWRGGVRPVYFRGARVRFLVGNEWVRGRVRSVRTGGRGATRRVETADVDVRRPVPAGAIGMWDLPDARIRNGRVYARGCDDLAGVAAMLCCLETLSRRKARTEAYFLFTRAEEVGFVGAMAACRQRTVPERCLVVTVETSSQLRDARMGDGPILRVGDKATTYFSAATSYCQAIADAVGKRDRTFAYQRKLMDGGTCESTVYCQFGYEATGLCLALGNYHNMNLRTGRIGAEYVDLADFANLVKWFVALTTTRDPYTGTHTALRTRLRKIEREHATLLRKTRNAVVPAADRS